MKVIRVSAMAAVMATSALLLAGPPPANAEGTTRICETYGNHYCIGVPSLGNFDPVKETTSGRTIYVSSFGGHSYKLELVASDRSQCIGANNAGDLVVLRPCNDGDYVMWTIALGPDGKSCTFESQQFSGEFLIGNNNGTQFQLNPVPAPSGVERQFLTTTTSVISWCS